MPRLPGPDSLGEVGSFRSGRSYLGARDVDASAIGQSVAKAGAQLTALSERERNEQDSLDLLKADAFRKQAMMDHERTYENDPNYDKYGETFDTASNAIRTEASGMIRNPKIREKFGIQASVMDANVKDGILKKGMQLKNDAREVEIDGILEQNRARFIDPKATPEQREAARRDIDAHIELSQKSGLLEPKAAQRLKEKYSKQLAIDDVQTRLMVEPDKVLEDFEFLGSGGILPPGTVDASGPEFKTKRGEVMRTISSPGGAKFTVNTRVAQNFAGLVADLEAAGIDIKSDQSGGYNERKIAGTNKRSLHGDGLAIDINWSENGRGTKGAIDPTLAREIAAKHGAVWGGDWKNPDPMHFEFKDGAPKAVANRGLTQYAGLAGGQGSDTLSDASTVEKGELETPETASRRSALIQRYGSLDPKQRLEIMKTAQTVMSTGLEDSVEKDIVRIKAGLEPEMSADGELAIDRAERMIGKTQSAKAQKLRIKYDEAVAERAALAPLDEMDEDQAEAHIAGLKQTPWLRKKAEDEWKKKLKLRDTDPAGSVLADPDLLRAVEVAKRRNQSIGLTVDKNGDIATEQFAEGTTPEQKQEAVSSIFRARLDAQEKRGIPEGMQKVITEREAKRLLGGAYPIGGKDAKWRQALEAAAEKALADYGPEFGKRALEDAISFERRSRDDQTRRFEDKLITAIATGESVSSKEIRQYQALDSVDKIGRFLDFQPKGDDGKPTIAQPQFGTPTEQHTQWLMQNIQDPSAIATFDAKFGEGAAARAIYGGKSVNQTGDFAPAPQAPAGKGMMQRLFGG